MNLLELHRRTGSLSQLFGMKAYTLSEGKGEGLKCIDVYNNNGLSFTVLLSRGLDIAALKFKGINLSFLSSTDFVNSSYFTEKQRSGFMRNFTAGFLTTGGLTYMGYAPQQPELGLHGLISNIPATNVSHGMYENGKLKVAGNVRQSKVFGENYLLQRKIFCDVNSNVFYIDDTITNLSFQIQPLMILYHMNFGYPFLSKNLQLRIKAKASFDQSGHEAEDYDHFSDPIDGEDERIYKHIVQPESDRLARVVLENSDVNISIVIRYDPDKLPILNEWKSMGSGNYVVGIEPGTNDVNGKIKAEQERTLKYMKPLEEFHNRIEVKIQKMHQ